MIHDGKQNKGKITIDLSGPQGNAFYILGLAQDLGKQLEMSSSKVDSIMTEMKESNYEHLLQTFDREFGSLVDLYRGRELE